MNITPDFSEAVEFTAITPGTYKMRIVDCEQKTSQKNDPYLKWKFQLFGAEGAYAKFNNAHVWTNTMITGKGAGKLKELLVATGWQSGSFDPQQLLGKEVVGVLVTGKDQQGNPSDYPEVKSIKALA